MRQLFIFILLALFFIACSDLPTITAPVSTLMMTSSETLSPQQTSNTSNLTIDLLNIREKVITASVGDVISIKVPAGFENITWQVDYADSVVQPLMPVEELANPVSERWLFRGIAIGQVDIRFTTKVSNCLGGQPCPPAPPRTFVITINVIN